MDLSSLRAPWPVSGNYPLADRFDASDSKYNNVAFYHNPSGTRAAGAAAILGALEATEREHGLAIHAHETSAEMEENITSLQKNVAEDSIVAIRAGDGGLSKMLAAIRQSGLENPVLALPGGHMNDVASQLFPWWLPSSWRQRERPEELLQRRDLRIRELRPILATIALADGTEAEFDAYGYVSQGVTSKIAAEVNNKRGTKYGPFGRFADEGMMVLNGIQDAVRYQVSEGEQPPQDAIDIVAGRGRMAGNFYLGTGIFKPEFSLIHVPGKLAAIGMMAAMCAGLPVGRKVKSDETVNFAIHQAPGAAPGYVQIDGDRFEGMLTRLRVAERGVNMLTSR